MFRTLIYPSSGACDCVAELPHRSSCSQFVVCWRFGAAGFGWFSFCRLKPAKRSRKLLKMDILMSETCWAHKEWNKITSDIKLVFHSSKIVVLDEHAHSTLVISAGLKVLEISAHKWPNDPQLLCCANRRHSRNVLSFPERTSRWKNPLSTDVWTGFLLLQIHNRWEGMLTDDEAGTLITSVKLYRH